MAKVQQIIEDLKQSWYFRFYALLWLIFLIVGFVALGILANRSAQTTMQKDGKIWWTENKSMTFPRFHFHTGIAFTGNEIITNISCMYQNTPVQIGLCKPFNGQVPSLFVCAAVYGDYITITNNNQSNDPRGFGIDCNISTTGSINEVGQMIAFGLEGSNNLIGMEDPHVAVWIAPTSLAVIELDREIVTVNGITGTYWDRSLFYLSDVTTGPGNYQIFILLDGFGALNYGVQNMYNGWRSTADVGGFAYFLLMLHTALMILLGFFFTNNSSFLKASGTSRPARSAASESHGYASLDG